MIAEKFPEISNLPLEEKRALLDDLCEEIAAADQDSPNPAIIKILEERWRAHLEDPAGAITLEEFRKRIGVE
ncbi:MAG: addiction module protein [Verrucomicrobiae bacterium]|nr:addiction module protein [Verrucomicrobiae bacterium]